jgi:hypothetical protein
MRYNLLITVFMTFWVAVIACRAGHQSDQVSDEKGLRPVNYPTGRALKFSEDQVIKKEFQVSTRWQTITFEKPLQINREGVMGMHLAVDKEPYISTTDTHPLNVAPGDMDIAYSLRRLSDGALIKPEALLIGDNGVEVRVRPVGHLYPYSDKTIMTIALGTFKDAYSLPPPFPERIKTFTAMRIRSTEPFLIRYLYWNVDRHPDIFNR